MPAQAATGETLSREVSTAGLDLSSDAGVALLDGRIKHAIREICGRSSGAHLGAALHVRKCHVAARSSSEASVRLAIARARQEKYAGDPAKVAAASTIAVAAR